MIDAGVVATLEHRGHRRGLVGGEVLVRQGELSEMVFVVLRGELAITIGTGTHEVEVGRCRAGDLIGEVASLAGVPRSATVTAMGAAEVLAVEPQQFTEWLGTEPDVAAHVLERARVRLQGVQVAEIAVELLGEEARPLVPQMLDMARWIDLGAGEVLFAQGDEPDAAYFVLSGRLRVTAEDAAGETRLIGEVGRAEVVGEAAVIQRMSRPATVTAVRDCTLARFDIGDFEQLLVQHPALMLLVVRRIVGRLTGSHAEQRAPRSVALVVTAPVDPASIVEPIMHELGRHGRSVALTSVAIDELVGRNDIAQAAAATLDDTRLGQFLYELESVHEHLVFVTDAAPTAWSRRALQRADCVIVVASPLPGAAELAAIAAQLELCVSTRAPRWLVVLHPAATIRPAGGGMLLRDQFDEVHHVRAGHRGDLARIARLSVGRGVGLVLGGGGARGFAHLGVLRALEELDVPVDRVGGASMGAIFAAAVALDLPSDELLGMCRTQFSRLFDYTVPVVALLKAKRITANLGAVFGGLDADDLWIPFYCVSTNLTRSRLEVHRSGDLVTVIRASIAIPGVLPPVPFGEDLLVDGGLLDNVPADVMRADPSISTVIAVDVAPPVGPGTSEDYGTYLSGWRALHRFLRRRLPYPGVASVLVRSMITGSEGRRAVIQYDGTVDLYLAIEIPGVSMLEFDKIQPTFDIGYAASRPQIEQWVRSRAPVTSVTPSSS